jgi:hypothetical protein
MATPIINATNPGDVIRTSVQITERYWLSKTASVFLLEKEDFFSGCEKDKNSSQLGEELR